jgi:hypothetical protein
MRSVVEFAGLVVPVLCASVIWADNPGIVRGPGKGAAGQLVIREDSHISLNELGMRKIW